MAVGPRAVDATRPPGWFRRAYAAFAATGVARFVSRHVSWKLDPLLLRLTGGRVSTSLVFPSQVLETTGARTGARRRNAVIYFSDGDGVVIVASNAGAPTHPAWYHNLRANPEVTFAEAPMVATVVEDDADYARLWKLANNVFPAFERYRRRRAGSDLTIPIIRLTPTSTASR